MPSVPFSAACVTSSYRTPRRFYQRLQNQLSSRFGTTLDAGVDTPSCFMNSNSINVLKLFSSPDTKAVVFFPDRSDATPDV